MSDEDTKALIELAKDWVNILSITPLSPYQVAVAIEYTVPPDPNFKQASYKTATRWVKYVAILPRSSIVSHASLAALVLKIVRNVRESLIYDAELPALV